DGHHDVSGKGASLQLRRQVRVGDQRVIAPHLERPLQVAEDRAAVVLHDRRLAVDWFADYDPPAPRLDDRLVAEAYAQCWDPGLREATHHVQRDARVIGRARARRDDHAVVAPDQELIGGRAVIAHHLELGPELA